MRQIYSIIFWDIGSGIIDHIDQIDDIFIQYDVEKIKSTDGRDFVEKLCAIKCGNRNIAAQMKNLKSNIMILEKLENEYGSVDRFITSEPSYLIVQKLSDGKPEYKLHNMGESLVWEHVRNVGIDGAKPDVHLRRFFGGDRMGKENHSPATTQEVYDTVLDISRSTGFSMAQIDSFVWNFCADDFGEICSANPRCRECVIRKYCKRENI